MTESQYPYDLRTVGILKVLMEGDHPKRGFTTYAFDHSIELRVDCKDYKQSGRNIQIGRRCSRLIREGYIYLDRKGEYSISFKGKGTIQYYDRVILPDQTKNLQLRMFREELRAKQVALIFSTPKLHVERGFSTPVMFEFPKFSQVVCTKDEDHLVLINESNLFIKEGKLFVYCASHAHYEELKVVVG